MKLNIIWILIISCFFYSCNKDENMSLNLEQGAEQGLEKEHAVFLISTATHSKQEAELFRLVNEHRIAIGLPELIFEGASYYFAGNHSKYMITQGVTSHDNFVHRAQQIAISTGANDVAENVAKDYDTVKGAFEAWMDSEEHRIIIEGDFRNSAISIKKNKEGDYYFTQLFSK